MSNYIIQILDLILSLIKQTDNLIIFIPFASLMVSSVISITYHMIRINRQ